MFARIDLGKFHGKVRLNPSNMAGTETNIFAPENGWLEYFLVSFWVSAYFFLGLCLCLSFREGNLIFFCQSSIFFRLDEQLVMQGFLVFADS